MQSILAMLDAIERCSLVNVATRTHAYSLAYRLRNGVYGLFVWH